MTAAEDVVLASFHVVVSMADRVEPNKVDAAVVESEFSILVVTFSMIPSVIGTVLSSVSVAYV